jgi:hypothetical protein
VNADIEGCCFPPLMGFRCPVVSDEKSDNRIGYFSDNKEID